MPTNVPASVRTKAGAAYQARTLVLLLCLIAVELALQAPSGPLGTTDYRLLVEALPSTPNQARLHLRCSYAYGLAGRRAMQACLATVARDKVGSTVVGRQGDGRPLYIGGVPGMLERNTMRYDRGVEVVVVASERSAALAN